MNSWQCITIFIIFTASNSNAWTTSSFSKQKNEDKAENLPKDFLFFVNGLDRMVFRHERDHPVEASTQHHTHKVHHEGVTGFHLRRSIIEQERITKQDILGDMLMMKLVSYYENKYNVARGPDFTTRQQESKSTTYTPTPDTANTNEKFQEAFILPEPTEPGPEIVPEVMSL